MRTNQVFADLASQKTTSPAEIIPDSTAASVALPLSAVAALTTCTEPYFAGVAESVTVTVAKPKLITSATESIVWPVAL